VGMAIVVGALLSTASRGGIVGGLLGLVVALTAWAFVADPDPRGAGKKSDIGRWKFARTWAGRAVPFVVAPTVVIGGLLYAGPQARTELDVRLQQSITEPDLGYRAELWSQSLGVVRDFPAFGVGLQSWGEIFPRYRSFPMLGVTIRHAHNDYIEWAAEVGWVGVILTLLLGCAYVRWAFSNHEMPAIYRFGLLGALTAVLWHEFFDFGLRVPANSLVLAVLLGLMANVHWRAEATSKQSRVGAFQRVVSAAVGRWRTQGPTRRRRGSAERPTAASVTEREAEFPRARGSFGASALLLVSVACLTLGSARKFAESLLWRAASRGSSALPLTPGDATTWLEVARHLPDEPRDSRDRKRAIYTKAISLRPAYYPSYLALARLEEAPDRRLRVVDAAIFADPTESSLRLARATLLDDAGRFAEALREIEETAYSIPLAREHPYLRAEIDGLDPRVREAANRGFRRALAERPTDPSLMNEIAAIYAAEAMWKEAADLWARAADASRDWGSYGWAAGESYARAGLHDRAEAALRKTIEEAPDEGLAYLTLAVSVLLPQEKHGEAETVLEEALSRPLRQVHTHAKQRVLLLESLYRVRWAANDRRRALEALREAARIEHGDPRLQYELGLAYLRSESYDLAISALGRAISLDERNALYHYYRGVALEKTAQLPEAVQAYQRANQLQPTPASLQALARALEAAGRARRAAD
ncbi:MAG: O-antigen ligase family protein, partial [Candidatus Binatia bacterium]